MGLEYSCRLTESIEDDVHLCMVCKRKDTLIYLEFYGGSGEVGVIAEDFKKKKPLFNADIYLSQVISTIDTIFEEQEKNNE